jgi:leucyl/phenylalanyl-tRNA--protein transferase
MPLYLLDESLWFPPVEAADEEGLLAIGGDLSTDRLVLAYRSGIFPWFNDDELPMWWSPDPRFVLFPEEVKVSKSMRQVIKKQQFTFSINTAFAEVVRGCQQSYRRGQDGTWITGEMMTAYQELHHKGLAMSAEAWEGGELAGGLYGVRLGDMFFGESMFSRKTNASKFAFIKFVAYLRTDGVRLIDCQVHTEHLESLGARMIPRERFIQLLGEATQARKLPGKGGNGAPEER